MAAHLSTNQPGFAPAFPCATGKCYIPTTMKRYLTIGLLGFALAQAAPAAAPQSHTVTHGTVLSAPAGSAQAGPMSSTPSRGMSMADVVDVYGQPTDRHETVGDPPITRWDYPDFSVFFEYNMVLHSVVPGHPPPLYHRSQLATSD